MREYEHTTLSNLVLETKDGDWGRDAPADGYLPYRVIRGADFPSVRRGEVSTVPVRYLSAQTTGRRTLQPGDIIIETAGGTRDRSTGRTLLINESLFDRIGTSVTCASFARFLRIDTLKADPRFIYWYLQNLHESGAMWEHQVQHTGVARFQYTRFASTHQILLPARHDQEAIAGILSALDEKIAVNDRITSIVDDLAAVLFEEHIRDDAGISNVQLSHVADVNQRKTVPVTGGSLRYIDISSVSAGKVEWPKITSWDDAPSRARRAVSLGDTIWSTVRPNRKSFALILDDDPALVASTGFAVLTPTKVGSAFLYEVTKREVFVQYLESVAEGSAYPAVRAERFERATIPLPSPDRLSKFESIAMPLRRRAHAAEVESRTLAALRHELLPKLMSGEIRVQHAEKVVEDVT